MVLFFFLRLRFVRRLPPSVVFLSAFALVTAGESRMFQALVVPDRYPAALSASLHRLGFMSWLR